jgi:hypothetical protein
MAKTRATGPPGQRLSPIGAAGPPVLQAARTVAERRPLELGYPLNCDPDIPLYRTLGQWAKETPPGRLGGNGG